jgi:glucose/arabinose dehydrogenase
MMLLLTVLMTCCMYLDAGFFTAVGAAAPAACDKDIGGITLPAGFCATVFADKLGVARDMAVDADGDLYVALQKPADGGGIVALKDTSGSGHADVIKHFGDDGGSGLALHGGYLYFATPTTVVRYPLKPGALLPSGPMQTVVSGFPEQDEHAAKSIAIDPAGHLYVNVGAPSNACQRDDRSPGSPGIRPCPLLDEHGGIWRFDADKTGQTFPAGGVHYATGIRNAVAIAWDAGADGLYALQMGRDQLSDNWPKFFTDQQNAELPAEEFFQVVQGGNYGWPYCYYDQFQKSLMLAPEYGGDGKQVGECGKYGQPIAAFPGHWSPESVLFYTGTRFPAQFRDGAFIAFHGSWNRAPLPQAGSKVVFVPFKDGRPSGDYRIFADGFAGTDKLMSPGDANFRAKGLAEGPDGALYIGDTQQGRIWRVIYTGS